MKTDYRISLVVTSYNDFRITELIRMLLNLDMYEIIIADGGSKGILLSELIKIEDNRIKLYNVPGSIVESREGVRNKVEGDITVFIDTDEIPSSGWLSELTEPIIGGKADFCFGPTVPPSAANNRIERFVNEYDKEFYQKIVKVNPQMGPMGNSAWKTEILKKISFDTSLTMGGEDYDFNLKAIRAGYKGAFAPDAYVYHDQSEISTLMILLKKKFRYMVGAAVAYRKNSHLASRLNRARTPTFLTNDPLELLLFLMKPLALIVSLIKY